MTEFDHLIKNKANEAQYPYKASAWKAFLHKAGLKAGLSVGQVVTISLAAAVIVGSVTWGIFRAPNVSPTPTATTIQTDSITHNLTTTEELNPSTETFSLSDEQTSSHSRTLAKKIVVDSPAVCTVPYQKVTVKERLGKPIRINPDTIRDNVPSEEQLHNGHSRIVPE